MSNYTQNNMVESENHAWSILFKLIPDKSEVLDIGCSSGNFGKALIDEKKCIVDGLELDVADSRLAAKVLRTVWNLNVETDDLSPIKATYDIIVMADVIEHLVDPAQALRRLKKLLKPDGRLVFSVPNMSHLSVRLALLAGKFTYTETGLLDKTHLHYYDYSELQRVLNEAGMAVEVIDYPQVRYPRSLIQNKLDALGLEATEKFYQHLDDPKIYAYQFIGKASFVAGQPSQKKITAKQAVQNDFMTMADQIAELQQQLAAATGELDAAKQELTSIRTSRAYKLSLNLAKTANAVRRKR